MPTDPRPTHMTILEWFRERSIEPMDGGHLAELWAWRKGAPYLQPARGERVYAAGWLDTHQRELLVRTSR